MQDDSEAVFARIDTEPSVAPQTMDNAPKKKFSVKWLIAGKVLVCVLVFAVFGVHRKPFIGLWTSDSVGIDFEAFSDDDTLPFEGIEFALKRKGDF